MDERNLLAERFEASRPHLRAVAFRMLGSATEAEDAVQEAWLRLGRTDTAEVANLRAWLTTVVGRICLDMLRSRRLRKEEALDAHDPETIASAEPGAEEEAAMADSVGLALLVVLEALSPAERIAFVLHDMFDLPFDEIAPIVDRSTDATRQLASRARRRVQGREAPDADRQRQREIVAAFLAASRAGDFAALVSLLDPGVVFRADAAAIAMSVGRPTPGAPVLAPEIRGPDSVAHSFSGRARAAQPAFIDGIPGLVWAPGGVPRAAFRFTTDGERVTAIDLVVDPEHLAALEVVLTGE
jgi:RNA polymerase sigma-70 factor (ECF subfamily)